MHEAFGYTHPTLDQMARIVGYSASQTFHNNTVSRINWLRDLREEAWEIVKRTGTGFLGPEEFAKASASPPQLQAVAAAVGSGTLTRPSRGSARSPSPKRQRMARSCPPPVQLILNPTVRQSASVGENTTANMASTPKSQVKDTLCVIKCPISTFPVQLRR